MGPGPKISQAKSGRVDVLLAITLAQALRARQGLLEAYKSSLAEGPPTLTIHSVSGFDFHRLAGL